jgi:hypothetical protein
VEWSGAGRIRIKIKTKTKTKTKTRARTRTRTSFPTRRRDGWGYPREIERSLGHLV